MAPGLAVQVYMWLGQQRADSSEHVVGLGGAGAAACFFWSLAERYYGLSTLKRTSARGKTSATLQEAKTAPQLRARRARPRAHYMSSSECQVGLHVGLVLLEDAPRGFLSTCPQLQLQMQN